MAKLNLLTVRLVNGEHRIGIFASWVIYYCLGADAEDKRRVVKDMDLGTEILIDYGPAFFTQKNIADSSRVLA
jgi:hypothetical protein